MTFSGSFQETPASAIPYGMMNPAGEPEPEAVATTPQVTVEELVSSMVTFASYTHQLYTQTHLIHLNIETPLFLSVHKFLKNKYEDHIDDFDKICEFVRSLDHLLPMCQRGILTAYKGFKHVKSYDAKSMMLTYLQNIEDYGLKAKEMKTLAQRADAPDIENYFADLVGSTYKTAWFLKAMLRNQT